MRVFQKPFNDIWECLGIVINRSQGLQKPFSCAELGPDNDDFRILVSWMKSLRPLFVNAYMLSTACRTFDKNHVYTGREAFGAVFLFAASETVRRFGTEGQVWPVIKNHLSLDVQNLLFPGGHPVEDLKEVIEEGARALGLRHLFGTNGIQNWYECIMLQFGFTRSAIKRIPYWLCGMGMKVSMEVLLSGDQHSPSFDLLWNTLINCRNNNIKVDQARHILGRNPWILEEWIDPLLVEARSRPELSSSANGSYMSACGDMAIPFFSKPVIKWNFPDLPSFETHLVNLSLLTLDEAYYDVVAGDHHLYRIIKRPGGEFDIPDNFKLPGFNETYLLQLLDPKGEIAADCELQCWNQAEEINLFEYETGKSIEPWNTVIDNKKPYIFIIADDLEVKPESPREYRIKDYLIKVMHIEKGWPENLKVYIDDNVFWEPYRAGTAPSQAPPPWLPMVRVEMITHHPHSKRTFSLGSSISLKILGVPGNVTIKYARLNGMRVELTKDDRDYVISPLKLDGPLLRIPVELLLAMNIGRSTLYRHTIAVELEITGAFLRDHTGTRVLRPSDTITVEEMREGRCVIFPPSVREKEIALSDWAVMEGTSLSRYLKQGLFNLGNLSGYGASLSIKEGPFNSVSSLTLAAQVVQTGIVRGLTYETVDDSLSLHLEISRMVKPDEEHSLHIFHQDGISIVRGDEITGGDHHTWTARLNDVSSPPLIAGLSFRGSLIGTWWLRDESLADLILDSGITIDHLLDFLRWSHVPLLGKEVRPAVSELISSYPHKVIEHWLLTDRCSLGLKINNVSDEWLAVVCELFKGFEPSEEQVEDIVGIFKKSAEPVNQALNAGFEKLITVNPLLMAECLRTRKIYTNLQTQNIICYLVSIPTGFSEGFSDGRYALKEAYWLNQAAQTMHTDEVFIKRGIAQRIVTAFSTRSPLSPGDLDNYYAALNFLPFRHYITLRLLKEIDRKG